MSDIENYLIGISDQLCPLSWDGGFANLSKAEQVFVAVWELEAEINNGGFSQYYWNSAGDQGALVPDALETIGAPTMAGIVRRTNALFPNGPSADRDEREAFLSSAGSELDEQFDSLTDEFCAYPENLSTLLNDFVLANRPDIRGA